MKVELEEIRLAVSAISKDVCVGTLNKDKIRFNNKKDVTSDFIKAVIEWGGGYKQIITDGNDKWEIAIKKID